MGARTNTPTNPRTAVDASAILARKHPEFRAIVRAVGPCSLRHVRSGSHFAHLAEAIAYQQLNGRAAATIWQRVTRVLDGKVSAEQVLATPIPAFRSAGLSNAKTHALLDLAEHAHAGMLPLGRLAHLDDEAIIAALTQVRGIGRWTVQMFLMSRLGRLDVWPVDDFGVRAGYTRLHGYLEPITARALAPLGELYAGYRSVAAWYCWRALDNDVA
ncbi:MAG: DNA-3-methyladenine glycosylase family protein [Acidimicrobiia bacterium]